MKPKDIVVGQKYKHSSWPDTTYLGCCTMGTLFGRGKTKFLIIIDSSTSKHKIGETVYYKQKDNGDWWKDFSLTS